MTGAARKPYPVCPVAELPAGQRRIVTIEGKSIGVFNVDGRYFALRNRCPHRGAPLCEGQVVDFVTATKPYTWETQRPGEVIRCPWHSWEFDLTTGRSLCFPDTIRTTSYLAGASSAMESEKIDTYMVADLQGMVVVWL